MIELTFGRCENSKKVTCNLPGFLSRKRDFCVMRLKPLHRKLWNDVFWIPEKKRSNTFSGLMTVEFSLGEITLRTSDSSLLHPKTIFFGPTCSFSGIKLSRLKWINSDATFLLKYPEYFFLKFLIESFWIAEPECPFFRMTILKESPWLFLKCKNDQQSVQPSQYHQTINETTLPVQCAGDLHSRRAAPRLKKSAGLPSINKFFSHSNDCSVYYS